MTRLSIAYAAAHGTDKGRTRDRNEDYVWVDDTAGAYVVADGLGGHAAGDVASRLAATTAGELLVRGAPEAAGLSTAAIEQAMTGAIEAANARVWAAAEDGAQDRRMGAVIVAALVRPPNAYVTHAGDCRGYLARDSKIIRLTEDDSVVAQLIAAGELTEEAARDDPRRHFVTKVIGQERPVQASFAQVALEPGDWLLLCSDGLWDMVDDDGILRELHRAGGDPKEAVKGLIDAANAAGGTDNISVVAIRMLAPEDEGGS